MENQVSVFDLMNTSGEEKENKQYIFHELDEFDDTDYLSMEKEMLGIYLSGHPLEKFKNKIKRNTNINSLAAKQADMQNIPPNAHNLVQSDNLNASIGKLDFTIMQMQVKPEYAKMIDDYFDFFGYACNHVKVPNRNVRPHWTFTKTQGCTINANCPGDDEDMICKIYDNGITFWKNGNEVGNYTLDNRIQ